MRTGRPQKQLCKRGHNLSVFGVYRPDKKSGRYCKVCHEEYTKDYFVRHPDKKKLKDWKANLRKSFGITPETWTQMAEEQQYRCEICKGCNSNGRRLHVDHNHQTGEIRGLLCGECNRGIAALREDKEIFLSALEYLNKYNEKDFNKK